MKTVVILLFILTVILFNQISPQRTAAMAATNASTLKGPVVIELFTSQSCSCCPPADALLGQLAQASPAVIALTCPVTYWNHLSWRDTLSQEFCTARQNAYADARNSSRVFTPEALINGRKSVVGSNGRDVGRTIEEEAGLLERIDIRPSNAGYTAYLPQGSDGKAVLVVFGKTHTQDIPKGENRGATVSYTNPVIALHTLKVVDGRADIAKSLIPQNAAGFAVLMQDGHRPITAAGQLKF